MNRRGEAAHHWSLMRRDVASDRELEGLGKHKEHNGRSMRSLREVDLVPCTACGLRGHVAGDPDRCLTGSATRGLGGEQPDQGRIGR